MAAHKLRGIMLYQPARNLLGTLVAWLGSVIAMTCPFWVAFLSALNQSASTVLAFQSGDTVAQAQDALNASTANMQLSAIFVGIAGVITAIGTIIKSSFDHKREMASMKYDELLKKFDDMNKLLERANSKIDRLEHIVVTYRVWMVGQVQKPGVDPLPADFGDQGFSGEIPTNKP
jgi:hypothetical protein